MAKICVSFFQHIIAGSANNLLAYYESLISELVKHGNNVLVNNFGVLENLEKTKKRRAYQEMLKSIEDYKPDLIIAFNNWVDNEILNKTNCLVAVFDADSIEHFVHTELIKQYNDRYYMITSYAGWDNRYTKIGFSKKKICDIHMATAVTNKTKKKIYNISFIGANWGLKNKDLIDFIANDKEQKIYKILQNSWKNNQHDFDKLCAAQYPELASKFSSLDISYLFNNREYILTSLLDLGLSLWGDAFDKSVNTNPALAAAFIRTPIWSLQQNQDIYNSSKICLSISHPQTKGYAYPWRTYDIMASGGLLVSDRSDLLNKETKGIVKIPMYDSPYEVRDICKKYLAEPHMCEDIVAASNEFIKKHGRWDDNFAKLETVLGCVHLCGEHKNISGWQNNVSFTLSQERFDFYSNDVENRKWPGLKFWRK